MAQISNQKLLLTSVFKPFSVDDAYGVKENVCELMHNQVTRRQGVFSVRSHNRSFGLTFMAENMQVPTTVLDFPTQEDFVRELNTGDYSHVGISFIVPNFDKAKRMAELVRRHAPRASIFLGGHGATIPDLKNLVPCDDICRGEGVRWLREKFAEPVDAPLQHPAMEVDCYRRLMGIPVPHNKAVLIPGVGCLNKCSFCCTSHFFDGYTSFFRGGEDLFAHMERIADRLKTREFFVLDENFLDDRPKVELLAALMESRNRPFLLEIFSSLRIVAAYDPMFLLKLGVRFVWIGVESRQELFDKVKGIDARQVIARLRRHGISVLASTILFLDHHDEKGLREDVDYTLSLDPDFVQFMELSPLPGTRTYREMQESGRICQDVPWREWHGQDRIWFKHPHYSRDLSRKVLEEAFDRDFQELGPSLLRIAETRILALDLNAPANDLFLAHRLEDNWTAAREIRPLVHAMIKLAPNYLIRKKGEKIARMFAAKLGPMTVSEKTSALVATLIARLENRKVRQGRWIHQPPTFLDRYRQD
ncbi:MAG: cobalamin-dependent protein [Candidatus Ozemobacteraceae bacterium]